MATDMYVSGLPDMARSLGTDASGAQTSLAAFLAGIIVGQLLLGPLSDALGRRPVLLWGTALFTLFSAVCAAAPSLMVLDIARMGQGTAGAAGIVVSRAVVTDLFDDCELAPVFSRLGAITAAAPVLAPLAGGTLLMFLPWRYVFVVLALAGLLLVSGVSRWVPESHPPSARLGGGLSSSLRVIGRVAAGRAVLAPVLALTFGGAAVFCYLAGSTFVFQDVHGLSPALSSVVYGVNAIGNMAGSLAYGRLARRWSIETLLVASSTAAVTGPVLLLLVQASTAGSLAATWLCLLSALTALGVFFPAVVTVAQRRGRAAPGATSALLGGGQFLLGAAASPAVGLFGSHSPAPMAAVMAVCLALAALSAIVTRTPRRGDEVTSGQVGDPGLP